MEASVLVVGAGPVGLTMAAELTRYGVPVRIIDKAAGRTDKSKALVLWSRTLELIDRMECSASFVDAGFKVCAANIIAGNRLIAHVPLNAISSPHPYALMLPQSETERLMEKHLNDRGVQVERRVELESFVANADNVRATLHHPDAAHENINIKWMIGCDGAHSAVRHGLGMPFEGDTLPSDWILADIHLAGMLSEPDEINTYWHSEGVLAIFPISPGRYRIIADVGDAKANAPRADPTLDEVQAILDRRGPGNIVASEPIRLASFRINERKVVDYRASRVFLAGDAAHIHSPAGGQGMNTGMQDACNLAWKMSLVHQGLAAAEPLLESYNVERSTVGRQVMLDAGRLTSLAMIRGGLLQGLRNHVASLVFGLSAARGAMADKLTELSIGYPDSPLTAPSRYGHGKCGPGDRVPISGMGRPIGAGSTPLFALLARADAESAAFIARYPNLLEPQPRAPIDEKRLLLVRPDGYVALITEKGDWPGVESYFRAIAAGRQALSPVTTA